MKYLSREVLQISLVAFSLICVSSSVSAMEKDRKDEAKQYDDFRSNSLVVYDRRNLFLENFCDQLREFHGQVIKIKDLNQKQQIILAEKLVWCEKVRNKFVATSAVLNDRFALFQEIQDLLADIHMKITQKVGMPIDSFIGQSQELKKIIGRSLCSELNYDSEFEPNQMPLCSDPGYVMRREIGDFYKIVNSGGELLPNLEALRKFDAYVSNLINLNLDAHALGIKLKACADKMYLYRCDTCEHQMEDYDVFEQVQDDVENNVLAICLAIIQKIARMRAENLLLRISRYCASSYAFDKQVNEFESELNHIKTSLGFYEKWIKGEKFVPLDLLMKLREIKQALNEKANERLLFLSLLEQSSAQQES